MKNVVVIAAAGMGLVLLIWWIVTEFSAGGDDPASNTNPFAETPVRPEEISGGPSVAKGESDGQSSDGANNNQQPDGTRPKKDKKPPKTSEKKPGETTDPPANGVIARGGEENYVPKWVTDAQVGTIADVDSRPTVTVGSGSAKQADFTDLRKGLLQLRKTGGTVLLVGDGPFVLKPLEDVLRAPVVIRAEEGRQPLVMFTPGSQSSLHALLRVSDGSLSLIGIHLAVVAEQFPAEDPITLVEVDSGDLTVRNSSITLSGSRSGRTIAFRVSDSKPIKKDNKKDERLRVVIERTFVRGNNLLPLAVDTHVVDVFADNSLFATGSAPMLRLSTPAREPAGKKKKALQRDLRFLSCTAYCRNSAFELVHGVEAAEPPTTVISTVNSLFGSGVDPKKSALVQLVGWPAATGRAAKLSGVWNLSWETDSSLFLGWNELVVSQPAHYLKAANADSWNGLWKTSADGRQFQKSAPWPEQVGDDFSSLALNALDATTVPANPVRATDGGDPGCLVADLSAPQPLLIGRAIALAGRPITPSELTGGTTPTKTIKVDLGRQKDLGAFINQAKWPSGTLIIASGAGNQKSSPIRVRGKSLRIRFVQTNGLPLILEPRDVNPNGSPREKQAAQSFISVTDGSLQLIGGDFKIPLSTRRPVPSWFLDVENGDFSLVDCSVRGPIEKSINYSGLIRWKQGKQQTGTKSAQAKYSHYGLISDSFLTGKGIILQAGMRGQSLRLNNSVLVGFDDLFELDITGTDPNISGAVDVSRCTLSALGTFCNVKAGFLADSAKSPLRFFAEQTVFGKPVVSGAKKTADRGPVLFSYNAGAREQNQMTWWGSANGFAGEITHFVHDLKQRKTKGRQNFSAWRNLWGTDHVIRELSTIGDVEFVKGKLPDRHKLGLADFTLHSDSRASGWGHGGKPIGADIDSIRVPTAKTAPADGKKKNGTTTKPPRVDF